MEKIKRAIKLFFVKNGSLLSFIVYIFAITIFIVQILNKYTTHAPKGSNNTANTISYIIVEEDSEFYGEKEFILEFLNYCNNNEIEKAYNMLSDKCKQEKYPNIDEFKKYVEEVFKIKICDYIVMKNEHEYKVNLVQDMLITGKKDSIIEQKYKIEDLAEKKIEILN